MLTGLSVIVSLLQNFDTSALLAGVQYECNHKQTVNGTIRNILYIEPGPGQL